MQISTHETVPEFHSKGRKGIKGRMGAPDLDANETPFERVLRYQDDLIGFFTNSHSFAGGEYGVMRKDLLNNPAYGGLAPAFLRRCRDTSALWSFAKSVNPQWEPRRQFLRDEFEPLLERLEGENTAASVRMPGTYDASAWTGVPNGTQRVRAVQTLIPVAQSAVASLIQHLEQPGHNGGPRLDEVETALTNLRALHSALGKFLTIADEGKLATDVGEGLVLEIARFARRSAKALKEDPIPYALSGTLLALFTACGVPGLGGYLGTVALMMTKSRTG
jgi:hypothetical protein